MNIKMTYKNAVNTDKIWSNYFGPGGYIYPQFNDIWGDCKNIEGSITSLRGDVSHLSGNVSMLVGNTSEFYNIGIFDIDKLLKNIKPLINVEAIHIYMGNYDREDVDVITVSLYYKDKGMSKGRAYRSNIELVNYIHKGQSNESFIGNLFHDKVLETLGNKDVILEI